MKRLIIILMGILLPLISLAYRQKTDTTFTVTIKTKTTGENVKAYLLYQFEGRKFMDSAIMQNHVFSFKGNISQPVRATLVFDVAGSGLKAIISRKVSNTDFLQFYIHPGHIEAITDRNVADALFLISKINQDFFVLQQGLQPILKQHTVMSERIMAERDTVKLKILKRKDDSIKALKVPVLLDFMRLHRNSYIVLTALQEYKWMLEDKDNYSMSIVHLDTLQRLYNGFSTTVKQTILGRQLDKDIHVDKVLKPGAMAPSFAQPDVNGRIIKLSSFRGSYVLLDVWASWCGPCRQNNPAMVQLYHDFKSRNFAILGISLDDAEGRDNWIKAIKDDHLEWAQVSDLKHWDNQVVKLYSIKAIPESILIDPQGRIVARGLPVDQLREKLNQLLPPLK